VQERLTIARATPRPYAWHTARLRRRSIIDPGDHVTCSNPPPPQQRSLYPSNIRRRENYAIERHIQGMDCCSRAFSQKCLSAAPRSDCDASSAPARRTGPAAMGIGPATSTIDRLGVAIDLPGGQQRHGETKANELGIREWDGISNCRHLDTACSERGALRQPSRPLMTCRQMTLGQPWRLLLGCLTHAKVHLMTSYIKSHGCNASRRMSTSSQPARREFVLAALPSRVGSRYPLTQLNWPA